MEPELVADPWSVEYSESWSGELGQIGEHVLTNVQLHMTHAGYRVESHVRRSDKSLGRFLLSYSL